MVPANVQVLKQQTVFFMQTLNHCLQGVWGIQIFLKLQVVEVVLGILKPGASKTTNITVTRDRMPLPM
jgi:hypothetical protein